MYICLYSHFFANFEYWFLLSKNLFLSLWGADLLLRVVRSHGLIVAHNGLNECTTCHIQGVSEDFV